MSKSNNFNNINHTYSTNLSVGPGTINSLGIKTVKKILNINTAFRDNYSTSSATNFTIRLPQTFRKVISMKVFDYSLPKHNYSISQHYNNNNFTIIVKHPTTGEEVRYFIIVPDGLYTLENIDKLITNVNTAIFDTINSTNDILPYPIISIDIDTTTLKTKIFSDPKIEFRLDFSFDSALTNRDCNSVKINNLSNRDQLTLGWILGFRGDHIKPYDAKLIVDCNNCKHNKYKEFHNNVDFSYPEYKDVHISEGLLNLPGEQNLLLAVEDFQNNNNNNFISPFKNQSLTTSNILAILSKDKQYSLSYPPRIYFGPTDIEKISISIYDEFGRLYNNNYGDYSVQILLECIYDGC